ncbi:MAG TPA: AMP-dependent synthetase/ligase [Solirubrobacteraceae bacterium]|nr:AMP-dependent synthetase/ligase [Solirubrobacteraceae bacterium]
MTATPPQTIAQLLPLAAERHRERIAVRHRRADGWQDVSYAALADRVNAIALGLVDLGVAPGERVAILAQTRPEWTYVDLAITAAGAVVVPVYPTNSGEECEWVLRDSDAVAIVCEDALQAAKVRAVQDGLPNLKAIVTIEAITGTLNLQELIERGRRRDDAELGLRAGAVCSADPYTFIYTSGTTGPPKGCVLTHGNFRAVLDTVREHDLLSNGDDTTYLYLPLAHALALIMQLAALEAGGAIAYFGGDARQVLTELQEVAPTFLPSVPRIFEKVYAAVTRDIGPMVLGEAIRIGGTVEDLRRAGAPVSPGLQESYERFDELLFRRVRDIFGGRLRLAITGAAPVAPEILELFWASGVPVMEGYGMTETASAISIGTLRAHRFGTVGCPLPGVDVRIAGDGEILVRGANVFAGYHKGADTSFGAVREGWLHTGDLGAFDDDGFLSITGRKKDIIITAGGKNIAPANLENDLKQSRWISHAVMHGDRRPYPVVLVTLDDEELAPWAERRGLPRDPAALSRHPDVAALVQAELDKANRRYAQVEQAKRFAILDHDLSQEAGELTPTLKVKRDVVNHRYAAQLDALYE